LWAPAYNQSEDDYVSDMGSLLHKIHEEQFLGSETAGDMSYHASHGLIWQSIPLLQPNMTTYPVQLAHDYCGDYYGYNDFKGKQAHKYISHECFHGIGHGVFLTVVRKQLQIHETTSRLVFKPSNGFHLSSESWCLIHDICSSAANLTDDNGYSTDVMGRCFGGARHSVLIYALDEAELWGYLTQTDDRVDHFFEHMQHCYP
jgi:hypothetical protein